MNASLQRGYLLLQQNNPRKAEDEARAAIEADVNDPEPYGLLALALAYQKRYKQSLQAAETGLGLDAGSSHMHYILGSVLIDAGDFGRSRRHLDEAISLDPCNADYYSQSATLFLVESQSEKALSATERGLEIDPEHVRCQNLRTRALIQLGRQEEAHDTLDNALRRDPDNAQTHANRGYALLHQNQPKEALNHFREALRLDPEDSLARFGIVEALKARNPVYRLLLQYFLWLSRMSNRTRLIVIIAPILAIKVLRGVFAETNPVLVISIGLLYLLFVLMTWSAAPLFNLLLRLDSVGKYALDEEQILESNLIGLCILTAVAFALSWFVVGEFFVLFCAVGVLSLMIPLSRWFGGRPESKGRIILRTYITILVALLVCAVALAYAGMHGFAGVFTALYLIAITIFTWAVNLIAAW